MKERSVLTGWLFISIKASVWIAEEVCEIVKDSVEEVSDKTKKVAANLTIDDVVNFIPEVIQDYKDFWNEMYEYKHSKKRLGFK